MLHKRSNRKIEFFVFVVIIPGILLVGYWWADSEILGIVNSAENLQEHRAFRRIQRPRTNDVMISICRG